jgi:hypothetical protein
VPLLILLRRSSRDALGKAMRATAQDPTRRG